MSPQTQARTCNINAAWCVMFSRVWLTWSLPQKNQRSTAVWSKSFSCCGGLIGHTLQRAFPISITAINLKVLFQDLRHPGLFYQHKKLRLLPHCYVYILKCRTIATFRPNKHYSGVLWAPKTQTFQNDDEPCSV